MMGEMDNQEESLADPGVTHAHREHLGVLSKVIAHTTATVWRWGRDPGVLRALLGRYGAHLAIVALAVLLTALGQLAVSPAALAGPPSMEEVSLSLLQHAAAEPVVTVTPDPGHGFFSNRTSSPNAITRAANPLTTIPERVRLDVITYTVQPGDSVFGIALDFKLSPYSIVWSNMEALQGAPWLISPGLTLYIPPVDGAYHTVMAGETPSTIAAAYRVSTETLYNIWNTVEPGETLAEGALLMIPGGTGGDFDWDPPPPPTPVIVAAPASPGRTPVPMSPSVYQPASGSFILPTGSYAVSGWVFRDRRNPRHQGLDYRCRLGDPIYAADSGTVIYAGWGGGYGNLVQVDHGNGFVTYYAHFTAFAVVNGQGVAQGQVVGYCGSTGYSSGPHLHYEIRYNGVPQDPAFYQP
jgi:murein DD-endopeptidase MepM/ murein hydrolase activator NlpD